MMIAQSCGEKVEKLKRTKLEQECLQEADGERPEGRRLVRNERAKGVDSQMEAGWRGETVGVVGGWERSPFGKCRIEELDRIGTGEQ
jgi:hypothetical protein